MGGGGGGGVMARGEYENYCVHLFLCLGFVWRMCSEQLNLFVTRLVHICIICNLFFAQDNFLMCHVTLHGRCRVWHRLSELGGVVLSCFMLSRSTIFTNVLLNQTGRLIQPAVQGSSLISVMGQETCEQCREKW